MENTHTHTHTPPHKLLFFPRLNYKVLAHIHLTFSPHTKNFKLQVKKKKNKEKKIREHVGFLFFF